MRGEGNGESLSHLPVKAGDCLLADRAYSTAEGIHHEAPAGRGVRIPVSDP